MTPVAQDGDDCVPRSQLLREINRASNVNPGRKPHAKAFFLQQIVAKHDETYIPAEAVEAMRQAGTWRDAGEEGDTAAALEQAAQETSGDPCPPIAA